MIGLDTNLLVRYFTRDDLEQCELVSVLLEGLSGENPGYVSLVTVVELWWVLGSRSYRYSRSQLYEVFRHLLQSSYLVVESREMVANALHMANLLRADFADCLIQCVSMEAGCETVFTFDKDAARAAGMTLLG